MNGGMQLVLGRALINAQMLGFGDEAEICARPEHCPSWGEIRNAAVSCRG
jgi:hypothetical protein